MRAVPGGSGRKVRLAKALERTVAAGHPWIFRDALAEEPGEPGDIVTVLDRRGRFLARGIVDLGPIGVRVWTTRDEPVGEPLFARRIADALALRDAVRPEATDALRLLHGEGDRMPGVVCDAYASVGVVTFDGAGATSHASAILDLLVPALAEHGIGTVVLRERQKAARAVAGELPTEPVRAREHGMVLLADVVSGQKTGLFFDHRESRRLVRRLASGRRVLNLYGYTGGFSVAAGLGGASRVETVDVAAKAIDTAVATWAANGLEPTRHEAHVSDVRAYLEGVANARYDIVVADPPSFAPRADALDDALRAYGELHAACLRIVEPGGLYLAASCSSHVRRERFDETIRDAARRVRRPVQILEAFGAPADHPRLVAFPEGDYLKVSLARVL